MEGEKSPAESEKPRFQIQRFEPKYQKSAEEVIARSREEETGIKGSGIKERYYNITGNCQRYPYEDFWIIVDGETDTAIGTTGLKFLKEGIGQIIRVGVDKPFRKEEIDGQRLSDRMIEEALMFGREKGYREIYLTTGGDDKHVPAQKLYERHGFSRVGLEDLSEEVAPLLLNAKDVEEIEENKAVVYIWKKPE